MVVQVTHCTNASKEGRLKPHVHYTYRPHCGAAELTQKGLRLLTRPLMAAQPCPCASQEEGRRQEEGRAASGRGR